jgi:hypothetical protein
MNLMGLRATIWAGPTIPAPLPAELTRGVQRIEIRHSDRSSSGCSVTLAMGRQSNLGLPLYDTDLSALQLRQGNRISVTVSVDVVPEHVFDGLITEVETAFGDQAGTSTLTIRCRDMSVKLGLEEKDRKHTALSDDNIVRAILAEYLGDGLLQEVHTPLSIEVPLPNDTEPNQRGTDLAYIQDLARKHSFVFYVAPGPAPGTSIAYWGPEPRIGLPQRGLTVNMGGLTDTTGFQVTASERVAEFQEGKVRDRLTGASIPVMSSPISLNPPLSAAPSAITSPELIRRRKLDRTDENAAVAFARAQARANSAADGAMRATGTVDVARYGSLLWPRQTVGVRGVGQHNGVWYVEQVRHTLQPGDSYRHDVTLRREGSIPLVPAVFI